MGRASISELKANLSKYVREVRRGGEVQILDRGVPVARLVGVSTEAPGRDDPHRQRLIASGILRPAPVAPRAELDELVHLPTSLGAAFRDERDDRL